MDYFLAHPDAKIADVATAVGSSENLVATIKKSMGLTKSKTMPRSTAVSHLGNSGIVLPSETQMEHLKSALKHVANADELVTLLNKVDAAGGVQAVRSTLDTYRKLQQLFGADGPTGGIVSDPN